MNFVDVKTLPAHARNGADAQSSYPLITIAIPTYNRSGLVKSCVENALAQSYRNIDVMVSDNASPDDTLAVLKTVNDKRLRVLTNPKNVGAIENHAKCLREAKGDYLVLVSDDNILDAQFLEKCVRLIRQEPGLPIVLAAYDNLILDEFHEGDRRLVPAIVSKRLSTGIWDGIEVLREYFHGRLSADSLSVVVRTDVLRRNDRYSNEYLVSPDKATWIPALLEGRAGLINEACATYLIHGTQLSSHFSPDERLKDFCKMMQEVPAAHARKFPGSAKQGEIRSLSSRYLAYQAMVTLVLYRREGASATDAVRKFWQWRPMLQRCTWTDFLATVRLRSLARILLPRSMLRPLIALGLGRLNR